MESVSLTCWGLIGNGGKWSCTIVTILPWTWSFLGERMIRRMTWDLLGGPTIWAQRPDKHPSWEKSKQLGPKPWVLRHWSMDVVDDLQLFFRLMWIWISEWGNIWRFLRFRKPFASLWTVGYVLGRYRTKL